MVSRHVSNSDLQRQQVWSDGSDLLWTERSQSILHFISCGFHQRSLVFSDNEPSTKALQDAVIPACVGVEAIPQGQHEGDPMVVLKLLWEKWNGSVEQTLRISAEQNTSVRLEDDSPLHSWFPRFAAQVMNTMRIGKDGKTIEMRRIGRRWRKPISRMTQGIFVGHHDRTGAVCALPRMELCEAKVGRDRHWAMLGNRRIGKGLCGTPWQMVAPEVRLTSKVTADKEGAGLPLPRIVVERAPEAEPWSFYVFLRTLKLTDTRVVQNVQRWHRMEKRQSHTTMNTERENQIDHWENFWRDKQGWLRVKTESLRQRESKRDKREVMSSSTCWRTWRWHHRKPSTKRS